MFLFRCCLRVDCGCQSEADAEVSRSSHSTRDYSQQSEKQVQRRLLPQPVVTSCTKHFTDYSGCSQSTASRSLLIDSTQSVDYEEVLCISVPSRTENEESIYSRVDDNVICKPPRSIGIVNNNFSPDPSSTNNNLLQPETNDNERLVQDGGPRNGSGSDESSDVSSASSNIDECNSAEVKYVADIRQFRPMQTSVWPHGDDCCCATCQSDEGFDRNEDDALIHHSDDLKCSCKSCRDFQSRMQCAYTSAGFTATAGGSAFSNQYRLMTSVAQGGDDVPLTWSQSSSKSSVVYKIVESPSFNSRSIQPVGKSASMSAYHCGHVFGAFESEEADDDDNDDDDGLFSSDDELHYVFHKFIGDRCLEEPFADVSTNDGIRPGVAVQSESAAEVEHTSARSADDLEVAFFMVGNISSSNPPAPFPDGSFVTPAIPSSVAESTGEQIATDTSGDSVTVPAEFTAHSLGLITEPSVYHENLFTFENDFKPYSANVICKDMEADTFASVFEASTLNVSGAELGNVSGVLRVETSGPETDVYEDSNVNDNEDQQTCSQLDVDELRRDVIVQKLSDNLSFFIELPAAADERVSDADEDDTENITILPSARTDDSCTTQQPAPAEDDAVIGQRVEIVTPECIIEHPVFIDEVKSSQTANGVSYGYSQPLITTDVVCYICDIVADAVQQIADNAADASVGMCSVASEDISSDWPKQILITPLPGDYHRPATEDECDRLCDNLPGTAAGDTELQFASGGVKCSHVGTDTVGVLDADADVSRSNEAILMTDIQAQEVPQVENYLISYDSHLSQQPIDDSVDTCIDRTPIRLSHSARPHETDVELCDLVQPLEHAVSETEQAVVVASELNLDSEDHLNRQGAGQDTFAPTDIVEDFFMQYVLPVDNVCYGRVTDAAAAVTVDKEDETDRPEVGQDEEDLVTTKALENTAQNIVDIVIRDAVAETNVDAAVTSAVLGAQYDDVVDQPEVDQDLEGLVQATEVETAAQTLVDVVVNDAIAETDVGVSGDITTGLTSSPVAAGSESLPVMPTRSSCLLHSPSESLHKKSVHFADMHGLQLETVQHYDQAPEFEERRSSLEEFLSKLSAAAAERRAKWTEHHTNPASSWLCSSSVYLLACFELPGSQEELLERVRRCRVALESCSFDDLALAISGIVRVANIAFNKKISVRYSVDHWTTLTDIDGEYVARSNDGPTDRFSFTIILPSVKQFVIGSEVEFAIHYVAGDGPSFEFWDSNHGRNYVVRCCSKATSSDAKNDNDDSD